jgi:hypothetical protein
MSGLVTLPDLGFEGGDSETSEETGGPTSFGLRDLIVG